MTANSHSPIGKMVKIDSHRSHLYSIGEGSPSVTFESGGASWSLDWYLVQSEAAKFTTACSYTEMMTRHHSMVHMATGTRRVLKRFNASGRFSG